MPSCVLFMINGINYNLYDLNALFDKFSYQNILAFFQLYQTLHFNSDGGEIGKKIYIGNLELL